MAMSNRDSNHKFRLTDEPTLLGLPIEITLFLNLGLLAEPPQEKHN